MKILWIVNSVLNDLSLKLYGKEGHGVWMDALLSDFRGRVEYEIVVATVIKRKAVYRYQIDNVTYYALPDQYPARYKENKSKNIVIWQRLIAEEKPDLIQVWGTEFTHGLCALRQAKGIPSIVYMQGYLKSIARFYQAGIDYRVLRKSITFRDIVKRDSICQQQKKYMRSSQKEAEMLQLSGAVISENEWCNAYLKAAVPNIRIYDCPLSINKVFAESQWDLEAVERHSVICTAPGYTIKGLHILLKAIALLKQKYPDIKLYVPGTPQISDGTFKGFLKKDGYTKYIEKLIRTLDIEQNICWLGRLSQEVLAAEYAKRHIFVMPSAIENHSSSLKEAMSVGMPCIASYVGGIPEYVRHGESGFLYRFEEYEVLATRIGELFDDDALCRRISKNAREQMTALHQSDKLFEKIEKIYKELV